MFDSRDGDASWSLHHFGPDWNISTNIVHKMLYIGAAVVLLGTGLLLITDYFYIVLSKGSWILIPPLKTVNELWQWFLIFCTALMTKCFAIQLFNEQCDVGLSGSVHVTAAGQIWVKRSLTVCSCFRISVPGCKTMPGQAFMSQIYMVIVVHRLVPRLNKI